MKLFYRDFGSRGPNVIILHGLFGSSDNWLPQAKMLSDRYRVYLPDLRNHGQSPHSEEFNYGLMAGDVREFIRDHELRAPVVIGHSMGGKAAMTLATHFPNVPAGLIVVDIAPKAYAEQHGGIIEGLLAVPVDSLRSRTEADEALAKYVSEPAVRQFLLKNLQRKPAGGFGWKMNLDAISRQIASVGEAVEKKTPYKKPVLFIRGTKSAYLRDDDLEDIRLLFPEARISALETGHWVHTEKPQELVDEVVRFLEENKMPNAEGG